MRRAFAIIGVLICGAPGPAADGQHAHPMPELPIAALERPLTLRDGIASTHDEVTTKSAEAQRFYDQGLTYLHHFGWIEAARSFNQAARLDADLALAHVGLSLAYEQIGSRTMSQEALDRALALASRATAHDRTHIVIRQRQIAAQAAPGSATAFAAYRAALDDGLRQFPRDVELWLARGVAESASAADRGQGVRAASIPFFEKALEVRPDHFAAHHYLAHAYENEGKSELALTRADRYATLAPNVAHARHMRGHDLRRLGRMKEAVSEFVEATRLTALSVKDAGVAPENDWHYEHNLDLLASSQQYLGQMRAAERAFKEGFDLPTANLVQAVNKRMWPMFLLSMGRIDEARSAAATLADYPHPVAQAIGHIESAHALLAAKEFTRAADETNQAVRLLKADPPGAGLAAVWLETLQGEFYLRSAQRERGRNLLTTAIEKARAQSGPDEWAQSLFAVERIARAAREAGDWTFAGQAADAMRRQDERYGGSQYATALALEHAGDVAGARAAFERARAAWRDADPGLRELKEIDARTTARRPAQAERPTPPGQTAGQPRPDQILFLDIPATAPWTDTGISVQAGDRLQIRARGTVGFAGPASGRKAPPAGSGDAAGGCEFVVTDGSVPAHSLVGNIAPALTYDGKGFVVGASWNGAVPVSGASAEAGKLFLGFNDRAMLCDRSGYDSWGFRVANSGSFSVELSITRH